MKMQLIRASKNGIEWEEFWIKCGTSNVERKRFAKHGYAYFKLSIVTKEVE